MNKNKSKSLSVLFVCSGNSKFHSIIPAFIESQANSLRDLGLTVAFFQIKGNGVMGYLKSIRPLKQFLKANTYDIMHAHYGLSAMVASLANKGKLPFVVSFMGEAELSNKTLDKKHDYQFFSWVWPFLNRLNARFFADSVIVKSKRMGEYIKHNNNLFILPNGVDLDRFFEKEHTPGINSTKKNILWIGNKNRPVKGFDIAQKAVSLIEEDIEFVHINNIPNEQLCYYYNTADVFLMTSLSEGSPNVVKEAMACNTKIVSTPVGDVPDLLESVSGSYVSNTFDPYEIAQLISTCLNTEIPSNSRQRIISLGLSTNDIALKLNSIYEQTISSKN